MYAFLFFNQIKVKPNITQRKKRKDFNSEVFEFVLKLIIKLEINI